MTRPWGLEVDRVELMVGAVLKAPEDCPGQFIMPPSVPGLEGLAGPIQQLAMHFLGKSEIQTNKGNSHFHLLSCLALIPCCF